MGAVEVRGAGDEGRAEPGAVPSGAAGCAAGLLARGACPAPVTMPGAPGPEAPRHALTPAQWPMEGPLLDCAAHIEPADPGNSGFQGSPVCPSPSALPCLPQLGLCPPPPPPRAVCAPRAPTQRRGFGTVRFTNKEDAQSACDKLNNSQIDGRTISVRIDRFA